MDGSSDDADILARAQATASRRRAAAPAAPPRRTSRGAAAPVAPAKEQGFSSDSDADLLRRAQQKPRQASQVETCCCATRTLFMIPSTQLIGAALHWADVLSTAGQTTGDRFKTPSALPRHTTNYIRRAEPPDACSQCASGGGLFTPAAAVRISPATSIHTCRGRTRGKRQRERLGPHHTAAAKVGAHPGLAA